jgi:2-methylcitrate dehydratase PrpD
MDQLHGGSETKMNATEKLSGFVVENNFEDMPLEGVEITKKVFLDCLGVTLAGHGHPMGKIIAEFVKESGCSPKATVLGAGFKTAPAEAALANGTLGHALDYDDYSLELVGHPSVSLLPAILAIGEERGISGRKALEAYIIGFEIESKLGAGLNFKHYELGWHATGTLGTMGAAAACSKMLGFDIEQTRTALGIAASEASGLRQNFGTMTKPFHAGLSARNGVVAALLAEKGFTADKNILEAEFGFCRLFCGKGEYDLEKIIANLGQPFAIVKPGISLKPYPSCGATHTALDGILTLVIENDVRPEDVEKIAVEVNELLPKILIHSNPQTGLEGKFSMEFCMAIALLDRRVGLEQFTDEKAKDPGTVDILKRVKMIVNPDLKIGRLSASVPVNVIVRLKDGTALSRRVDRAKGNPEIPLSRDELTEKFKDCARPLLSGEKAERIIKTINDLEHLQYINELTGLMN